MATKENASGLLSKVAKFVRNPTTNWADLDNPPSEADSGYSKQALKAMIERKRQNDFVRKREFDQLRKLRNRDPGAPVEVAGRPSFYQSSLPSNLDERAHTLKKIDEIEAQMSKQWWKGKQIEGAQEGSNFPVSAGSASSADTAPPKEEGEFEVTQPSAIGYGAGADAGDFAKTQMASQLHAHPPKSAPSTVPPSTLDGLGQGFSTSRLFAVELSDDATDPELEEAAIRFANGDNDGAETGLLDALNNSNGQSEFAEIWVAALFDFYRATGQQSKFDALALDFAARVGRSAPAWHSMLTQPSEGPGSEPENTLPQALNAKALWECPPSLDLGSLGQLHLALASAPMPWRVSWVQLAEVQPEALKTLAGLFGNWCGQKVRLHFDGAQNLDAVLKSNTISGNKSVNTLWWRLRMDALRIMRMQDEFELVALDYCVTYEVSPPSWQDAVCEYIRDGVRVTGAPLEGTVNTASARLLGREEAAGHGYTAPMGLEDVPAVVVELAGEVLGDAADAL